MTTSPAALREPLQGKDKQFQTLVCPSRLRGRRVQVRHQRRGAYEGTLERSASILRRLRVGRNLSQHELADLAGVTLGTIQRLEMRGARRCCERTLNGLSAALGISVKSLEEILNLPVDGAAA